MAINKSTAATTDAAGVAQTLGMSQTKNGRRFYLKWAAIVIAIIIIVIIAMPLLSDGDSQKVRYSTAEASRGALTVTVTATGTLQPVNQVDLGSEISGTIKTVRVDFNDRVKQGQVLATINTDQLQARVNQGSAGTGEGAGQGERSDDHRNPQ
jgi:HlyD family secretion protein